MTSFIGYSTKSSLSIPVSPAFSDVIITLVTDPTVSRATEATIAEYSEFLVFQRWCDGRSIEEVAQCRLKEFYERADKDSILLNDTLGADMCSTPKNLIDEQCIAVSANDSKLLEALFIDDTSDLFRVFEEMAQNLIHPELLRGQLILQIPRASELLMIDRYYSFDDSVVREFLGRRLSQKARRDLDDVAEATHTTLSSCRRQFDNLKRIMAMLEDTNNQLQCIAVDEIMTKFHLSSELASWYTAYIFLIHRRFNLSSSRKPTAHLSASSLGWCAMAILNYWVGYGPRIAAFDADTTGLWQTEIGILLSTAHIREMVQPELIYGLKDVGKVDLDRNWRDSIREIRAVLIAERSSTKIPMSYTLAHEVQRAAACVLPQELVEGLETSLVDSILRNMLSIGGNLVQSKEYRDILEDLITRVFNPMRVAGLHSPHIITLLDVLSEQFQILSTSTFPEVFRDPNAGICWQRYVRCISICSLYLSRDNA